MSVMDSPVSFVDAASRYPWLSEVTAMAKSQDWAGLRQIVAAAPGVDQMAVVSERIAGVAGVEDWLGPIVERDPDDRLAVAVLADRLVNLAWGKRSAQSYEKLTEEQISGFQQTLVRVERLLIDQIAGHPDEPYLWCVRITSGMGFGVGLAEITRRYKRLAAIAPNCYDGALRYLNALYPKWYGTYPDALAFARTAAAAAPEGSLVRALPAYYYCEQWLMEPDDDVKALLKRPDTHQELQAAAQGSVLSPAHVLGPDSLSVHSRLAMLFGLGGWWADAWPHFTILGSYPVTAAWGSIRDRVNTYRRFYDEAQKAGEA